MDILSQLADINEKLLSSEDEILNLKADILKTEAYLSNFLNCLDNQKLSLTTIIENKNLLEEEKSECLKLVTKNPNDNIIDLTNEFRPEDNVIILDVPDSNEIKIQPKRKRKAKVIISKSEKYLKNMPPYIDPLFGACDLVRIPQIDNRIVYKLRKHKSDIYIGGSRGMLLRHSSSYTHIYDTGTVDDILQIEILQFKQRVSVIAFTSNSVIIFEDHTECVCHEVVPLPTIGTIFNNICAIFIPLSNGCIKKLLNHNLSIKNLCSYEFGLVRCFVPGDWYNKFALITLQDFFVYKVDKNKIDELSFIDGPQDVIDIRRIKRNKFLCYSESRIWILNPLFQLVGSCNCNGIKLLDVSDSCVGFIDSTNTLFLYNILDNGCLGGEIVNLHIDRFASALTIVDKHAYVSVDDDILII